MRTNLLPKFLNRQNGFYCMLMRDKIFRLKFLATAGCKSHFEMREPFIPGSRHAHLRCAIFCRKFYDRMKVPDGCLGPIKFLNAFIFYFRVYLILYPHLVVRFRLPVSK